MALNLPILLLRALRTGCLLARLGRRPPLRLLCSSQLVGQALSWLTPGASGDLWRAVMWDRGAGVGLRRGLVTVGVERVLSLCLLIGVGLVLVGPALGGAVPAAASVVTGLGVAAGPWVAALGGRHGRLRHLLGSILRRRLARRWSTGLRAAAADLETLLVSAGLAATFLATTVAVFWLGGLQVSLLVGAVGGGADLPGATAASCLSQAAGSLSALPLGLGAADAALVAVLLKLGSGRGAAAGAALLLRVAVTLPVGLGAAFLLWAGGRPGSRPDPGRPGDGVGGGGEAGAGFR